MLWQSLRRYTLRRRRVTTALPSTNTHQGITTSRRDIMHRLAGTTSTMRTAIGGVNGIASIITMTTINLGAEGSVRRGSP